MTTTRSKRFAGPLYAVMLLPPYEWWCVWPDARAAYAGKPPYRTGWVRLPDSARGVAAAAFDFLTRRGTGEVTPGAQYALSVAASLGGEDGAVAREDAAFATVVWQHLGCPPPPDAVGAPAASRPQPPPPAADPAWARELRLTLPTTRSEVQAAYRKRASETHPDKPGGSDAAFARVKLAHERAVGWCAAREAADE